MAKRCIGIDITGSCLHAVQVLRNDGRLRIEKVLSARIRRRTDQPSDMLKTLMRREGFDRRASVAVSIPHGSVCFRNVQADQRQMQHIGEREEALGEHDFPIQSKEIVPRMCSCRKLSDEGYAVLIGAVDRELLDERVAIFHRAGMRPELVGPAIFAVHSTVMVNHPEIALGRAVIAYVDDFRLSLAVTEDNKVLLVRRIPFASINDNVIPSAVIGAFDFLSRELEVTWRKAFNDDVTEGARVYLAAPDDSGGDAKEIIEQSLRCPVIMVDPCAEVEPPAESSAAAAMNVAEGLALSILAPDKTSGVNFVVAKFAKKASAPNLKRELSICAILAAVVAAVWLSGLFVKLLYLENKHERLKNELKETFLLALPEERNIINPVVQLDRRLQSLRANSVFSDLISAAAVEPLEVLHAITTNVPAELEIEVTNISINPESARVTGTCGSFETVYNWQSRLHDSGRFSTVDVQDVRREPESGVVRFTLFLSFALPE